MINRLFSRLEFLLAKKRLRLFKTIYVNFRSLPLYQALKLPIHVYGNVRLLNLRGSITIHSKIKHGMIHIGHPHNGAAIDTESLYLQNGGSIHFYGEAHIFNGASINVFNSGKLVIGDKVIIAEKVRIACVNQIIIGKGSRIAHETQIMDSNFHYITSIDSREVPNCNGLITLGEWCWVGNRSSIQKGTIIPDYTIVASNSITNKDFSNVPSYSIIGGIPAKVLKTGVRRIFDPVLESKIRKHYINHSTMYKHIEN